MITGNMFVIAVPDLQKSAAFYQDILGFDIKEIGDDGWRIFEKDACRIMAGECPDALPAKDLGDHSYFAYLYVEDVDRYYKDVSNCGAEIIKPLRSEAWGMREFGIRTHDGHRIMIATPL